MGFVEREGKQGLNGSKDSADRREEMGLTFTGSWARPDHPIESVSPRGLWRHPPGLHALGSFDAPAPSVCWISLIL